MKCSFAVGTLALLAVFGVGCSKTDESLAPLGPSALVSFPQISGNYMLAMSLCDIPERNGVGLKVADPFSTAWTITQKDGVVTGQYSASSPPAGSAGTFTARVDQSARLVITSLQFSWSSSHVALIQLAASGDGAGDKTQLSGSVSGTLSYTPEAGGILGTRSTCSGTMPFRFTKVT